MWSCGLWWLFCLDYGFGVDRWVCCFDDFDSWFIWIFVCWSWFYEVLGWFDRVYLGWLLVCEFFCGYFIVRDFIVVICCDFICFIGFICNL